MSNRTIIVGGTSGIGHALSDLYLKRGNDVTVVGRTAPSEPGGDRYQAVTADLSLESDQEDVVQRLKSDPIDTLLFTAGGLSAKSRVTAEGKDAAWMVNHIARKRLVTGLAPKLSQDARVGYISTWGSYKTPPPADYKYGIPGRDGMGHVLKSYVPNDALFARLAEERPDLHILGYNPGPTKGTALAKRQDTPVFVRFLGPFLRLMSRPVGVVSEEFLRSLETTSPGICWMNAGKTIARPLHL
ncbi:SDR family NAD(P)-dependent oxidoreductase [Roseobacteraceae bacterium S113]